MSTNRLADFSNTPANTTSIARPGFMVCPIGISSTPPQTSEAAALTAFYAWAWQRVEAMQQRRAIAEPASSLQQRLFAVMN